MFSLATAYADLSRKTVELNKDKWDQWMTHSFLTWRWWLGIVLIILPILLWIRYRNKHSADRLQYAGLFVALITSSLDYIGIFFGFWRYDYEVIPFTVNYLPTSFTILPITVMFLLQIKPQINPFVKGFFFAFFSVLALPLIWWIGIYQPLNWHFTYTFFIQYIMYLCAHFICTRKRFSSLTHANPR